MNKTTEALKLAEEHFSKLLNKVMMQGNLGHQWTGLTLADGCYEALAAIREVLANHIADAGKKVADQFPDATKMIVSADLLSLASRLALELECLLMDTKDLSVVSKWWDSAHEALEQWNANKNALYAATAEPTVNESLTVAEPTKLSNSDNLPKADINVEPVAFKFVRYVDGKEMAEGVTIERETTLEAAIKKAVSLCPNRNKTVLVYAAPVQPVKQEPVAWMCWIDSDEEMNPIKARLTSYEPKAYGKRKPLYASPIRTKDLTDFEIDCIRFNLESGKTWIDFARAVIAADRSKNK